MAVQAACAARALLLDAMPVLDEVLALRSAELLSGSIHEAWTTPDSPPPGTFKLGRTAAAMADSCGSWSTGGLRRSAFVTGSGRAGRHAEACIAVRRGRHDRLVRIGKGILGGGPNAQRRAASEAGLRPPATAIRTASAAGPADWPAGEVAVARETAEFFARAVGLAVALIGSAVPAVEAKAGAASWPARTGRRSDWPGPLAAQSVIDDIAASRHPTHRASAICRAA